MATLLLEKKGSLQDTQQEQDDENRQLIRVRRKVILGYLKSIEESGKTSPEEEMEESYNTGCLSHMSASTFSQRVILPVQRAWERDYEPSLEGFLLEQAGEEEEYEFLHDYVLDDLSVDYHSAKRFHEYLMSLRKQYDHGKRFSK